MERNYTGCKKVEYENNEENPDADNQLDKAVEEVKAQMK